MITHVSKEEKRRRGGLRSALRTAVLIIFAAQLVLSFGAPIARADLLTDQAGFEEIGSKAFGTTGAPKDIRIIVSQVIRVFLGFLGIIFVYLIVLAGYKWMTAAGDTAKVDEAKKQLQTGVIGLVIILAAYSITVFIVECAVKASLGQGSIWYCPSLQF